MRNRITIDFVEKELNKEGCILLTNEYINSSTKFDYICANGHKHSISWNSWQRGRRCFYCNGKQKLTIEFIKKEFKKENYILLTNKYINSKQKLKYICSNDHVGAVRWNDWNSGYRCYKCSMNIPSIRDIRKEFEAEGYMLVSNKYVNYDSKLKSICPYGHEYEVSFGHWKKGHRCFICAVINRSGSNSSAWKGGISCEPYCDVWADKEYKESIKERDGYKCQNLYCLKKPGRASELTIHHIDYNKKNCDPNNLITVCRSCNTMANTDRSWHKHWYQTLMNKKYNYNY